MAVAVAVAVSGGVALPVAGLTKRFFNHIQKGFLINVWGYIIHQSVLLGSFFFRDTTERTAYVTSAQDNTILYRHVRTFTDVYGKCFGT